MTLYAISEIDDFEQIEKFLRNDQDYAAYALGDLAPAYIDKTTWYIASQSGEIDALALIYTGLDPNVLFLMGKMPAMSALLLHGLGPETIFFAAPVACSDLLSNIYNIEYVYSMHRMRVTSGTFIPYEKKDDSVPEPILLTEDHMESLVKLQKLASKHDEREWSDVALTTDMLKAGFYYGIFEKDELIAAGGTHIIAHEIGVATLGNVVTHPDRRREGLGTLISSTVTSALLEAEFKLVVLNVRQNNGPAIRVYRKLGYKRVAEFIEGEATRY